MNTEQQHIIDELAALEANNLAVLKSKENVSELPSGINEQMIQGVLDSLPEMTTNRKIVSIKEGIRREKISGFSFLLRIAGAVAIIFTMGIMSYKMMNLKKSDCEGKDELACLIENTSKEEMLYYLMEDPSNIDEIHILEAIQEESVSSNSKTDSTELFEIELL